MFEKAYLVIFLVVTFCGCSNKPDSIQGEGTKKNYEVNPPEGYTGIWTVYSTNGGKKWIESHYRNGQKEGVELRWYPFSEQKMSLHTFANGKMHGNYLKWRVEYSDRVLVQGEYKLGEPWNGLFLEDWKGNLDLNLDVIPRNLEYKVREYKEGQIVREFWQP